MPAFRAGHLLRFLPMLALVLLAAVSPSHAQPDTDPRAAQAEAHIARCTAVSREAGRDRGRELSIALGGLLPFARDILTSHRTRASFTEDGRGLRVEIHLDRVRDMAMPAGNPATRYLTDSGLDWHAILQDRRSRIPALWRVDEASVNAAARAYDIDVPTDRGTEPSLRDSPIATEITDYDIAAIYTDPYTAFAGLVLQSRPAPRRPVHRIYAVSGTHVFENTDFRTWASGLTFGRAQFVSTAALRMLRDAAAYVSDMQQGGEVFITGQSQGGLTSQGLGFMLQSYLDARPAPHHLVHVVSWGAVGAQETLVRMIERAQAGHGRDFWPPLEAHWAASDPDYAEAAELWNTVAAGWQGLSGESAVAHVREMMGRMRVVAYFFEVDLFARAGTFPGANFAFPTALILPDECDALVAEALVGLQPGAFGVRLESHFLEGYRRAVTRGAIAVARPADPPKWQWLTDLLPAFDLIGSTWLDVIYLDGPAASARNWQACMAAGAWRTQENRYCRASHWPGCGTEAGWCLIRPEAVVRTSIASR